AEYVGGSKGRQFRPGGRYANLAELGLRRQFDADTVGSRERDREWQERIRLLHQPNADQYPDTAGCDERIGAGRGEQQRHDERELYRAGTSAVTFVLRLQWRTLCCCRARGWKLDRSGESVSGIDHARETRRDHLALREWLRNNIDASCQWIHNARRGACS